MVQFISFGSGSSGNCYYLMSEGFGLFIDVGIGIRQLKRCFSNYGLSQSGIKAVLVTHDHTDHVKCVGLVSQNYRVPVVATCAVHASMLRNHYLSKKVEDDLRFCIEAGDTKQIGPFTVKAVSVPHDSAENLGYLITAGSVRFGIITDVGHFTDDMVEIVSQATHLVVESNYDEALLEIGPYPERLKRRIRSLTGHAENCDTGAFLSQHLNKDVKRVWLCHLSEENNNPGLALSTVCGMLKAAGYRPNEERGFELASLPRRTPTLLMEL